MLVASETEYTGVAPAAPPPCITAPPPTFAALAPAEEAAASPARWDPTPRLRELARSSHKASTLPEILALIGQYDALFQRDVTRVDWREDRTEKLLRIECSLLRKLAAVRSAGSQEIAAKLQVAIDRSDLKEAYPLDRLTLNLLRSIRREIKAHAASTAKASPAASGDDVALIQAIARFDASDAAVTAWQADDGVSSDTAIVEAFDMAALAVAGIAPTTLAGLKAKAAVLPKLLVRLAAPSTNPADGDFDSQADIHARFAMAFARDVMAMGDAALANASSHPDPDAALIGLAAAHRTSEAAFAAAVEAGPEDPHAGAAEGAETIRLVKAMAATPAAGALGIAAKAGVICASVREDYGSGLPAAECTLADSLAEDLARLMPAAVGGISDIGIPTSASPVAAASPIIVPAWAKTVTMTREELQAAAPSLQSLPDILAAARACYGLGWTSDDDGDELGDLDDVIYARLAAYRCQSADEMAAKVEVLIWRLLEVSCDPGGSINGSDHAVLRSLLRDLRGAPQAVKLPDRAVCPVAEIARQDMECHRRLDAVVTPRGEPTATRVIDRLCGQQDALRELASWQQATSVEGALYAIILAGTEAAYLMEHDVEPTGVQERAKRLDRFLYPALGAIEQCSGISAETVGGEYHMPEDLNPLRDVVGASR